MRATARVERNAPGSSSAPMPRRKLAHTPKIPKRRPWRTAAQPSEATHLDTLSQANVMLSVGNNGSSQKALQQIELVFDAIESRAGNLVTASTPQAQRPRSSGQPGESGGAGGGANGGGGVPSERRRSPQSEQSVPIGHPSYSEPAPPSSHAPLAACMQPSVHVPADEATGMSEASRAAKSACAASPNASMVAKRTKSQTSTKW